ncbi:hypothetical protein V9T40_007221 [Parthenolecanium corni]|uniref:Tyrosine-protein kinase receptor n=1 Tax=Parthenolecanium corni TaxID=536013 RepID=A0AAN9U4S0_9HEMI
MRKTTSLVTFVAAIVMCAVMWQTSAHPFDDGGDAASGTEFKCSNIDIRNNVTQFDKLINCTVVEGSVQIVLLDRTSENDFANLSFPNLREITHYLLVWRVKGLKSLSHLFPNLAIIRGTTLFANTALALYENNKLQEIGLRSLTHILEGSIVIYKNYNLCFVTSIDWNLLMMSKNTNQSYYEVVIRDNKDPRECNSQEVCQEAGCERNLCWSKSHCQRLRLEGCHPLCAGGCHKPNSASHCYACRSLRTSDGECVSACPDHSLEYLNRTCVTEAQCRTFFGPIPKRDRTENELRQDKPKNGSYFMLEKWCVNECPNKYYLDKTTNTCTRCLNRVCPLDCKPQEPNFIITSVSEARQLQSCTRLLGSLFIEITATGSNAAIENSLEEYLGSIEEIHGELKIVRSHALVSLNFLRSLHTIKGLRANASSSSSSDANATKAGVASSQNQHALTVKDNKNLRQLWDWSRRPNASMHIEPGKIFFHFNPKLCMSEIDKLVEVAHLPPYINFDVSRESNGDQTACSAVPLEVKVEKIGSMSAILTLTVSEKQQPANDTSHGRYMVYYKPNEGESQPNHTFNYESISECGDFGWRHTSDSSAISFDGKSYPVFLPHLEPAVEYVFFVRSMHSTIYTSSLYTFTTKPAQPTPPLNLKVNFTTSSAISLSWQPPYHSHGTLVKYVVHGYWETDRRPDLLKRDYCRHKMKNEMLASKPVATTTTTTTTTMMSLVTNGDNDYSTAENACNCLNDTRKDNTARNCDRFEHDQISALPAELEPGLEYCDAYVRNFIRSRYLMLKSIGRDIHFVDTAVNRTIMVDEMLSAPRSNVTADDGKFDAFRLEVDASRTYVTIPQLRHFSQYIVKVAACLQPQPGLVEPCSVDAVLVVRTAADVNADRLDERQLLVKKSNQTTNITWVEPLLVNGFVHSYQLEYRNQDGENSKFTEVCIGWQKFRESNNTFSIGLAPGQYELRLRAVSLAGDGPIVITSFTVAEPSQDYLSIIGCLLVAVVIIAAIFAAFLYYCREQIKKNRILIASVNPRYEPVYVEDHWEVPRENLTLVKQLGRGTFGSVHEGILQPNDLKCAVKTVSAIGEDENMIFLKEATLMKEFHRAHHIVKLIGVVSKGTPVYVIMELMERGDLKSFLLRHGHQYCADDNKTLPQSMVLKMAAEIADGMAFLEAKKFVHRDLAARNCMVAADNSIKIGDFGLARDIYETDYYRKGDKGTLPIRWMAPESIRDGIFTSNSDMWSYGVVLWEITTLAQMPYHPRTNEEVIKYVQSGQTLEIPAHMQDVLKPLVKHCWRWHASHRPKFAQVLKLLDPYVDQAFRAVSFFHNGENANDAANVVPCQNVNNECYIYSDENDEINLYLEQSPGTSTTTAGSSTVKYMRYVPYRANGRLENVG